MGWWESILAIIGLWALLSIATALAEISDKMDRNL